MGQGSENLSPGQFLYDSQTKNILTFFKNWQNKTQEYMTNPRWPTEPQHLLYGVFQKSVLTRALD